MGLNFWENGSKKNAVVQGHRWGSNQSLQVSDTARSELGGDWLSAEDWGHRCVSETIKGAISNRWSSFKYQSLEDSGVSSKWCYSQFWEPIGDRFKLRRQA